MKKVGFIGVGNIGMGMAKSILREGFELTAYDMKEESLKEIGMGQTVKVCQGVLGGLTAVGMAEALVLGVKAGLRPEVIRDVISTSAVGSFQFNHFSKTAMERNFKVGPRLRVLLKDLGVVLSTAKEYGVPMYATAAAHEVTKAAAAIAPEEDIGDMVKALEKIVGIEVKKTS